MIEKRGFSNYRNRRQLCYEVNKTYTYTLKRKLYSYDQRLHRSQAIIIQ